MNARHFRINQMLARDSVKSRLNVKDGLSFTEFSYQLMQGHDFLHLHQHENCHVQIGGSDQWGNILAGCDLIRRVTGNDAYGVTTPLLTAAGPSISFQISDT
jgi:tyrosyl-tRNA synthetase